jgi:hypothetical protein
VICAFPDARILMGPNDVRETGSVGGAQPSVVRNADILMYDEGLFCGTEKGSIAAIVPIE